MKATIITIGDDRLIGQIVATTSVSIAKHLNAAGIVVREKISIGDDRTQIIETAERALAGSEVTVITGGLGPTKDDITKKTLAEMFRSDMRYDERVAGHVEKMLAERGIEFNELNRSQAMVPACCTVLFNAHGTAPGMWFERGGHVVVSLPGVPFEMEHLMEDEVMPRLKTRFALRQIVHRTMITAGLPESMLAKRIEAWENALPPYLKLAYLPNPGAVRLRLSAYEVEGESVAREIESRFEALRRIIPHNIIGFETATMQEVVHKILTERSLTLATAESCTGGSIAARFTAMPGASAYFLCGVVSYSNESKAELLGVDPADIARYGAVSEQVARQMAEGVRRTAGADYGMATTGIAGPSGGSAEKPVGTVWIAVATPRETVAILKQCGTDRGQIIDRASAFAIGLLRDCLNGNKTPPATNEPPVMPPPGARSPLTIPAEWRKCGPNKHSGRKKRRPLLLFAEKVVYLHSLNRVLTKNNQTMKVCEITGKVAIVGNNVSHSHHKTKRKFSPNLKTKRFWSEQEGRWITL